MAVFNEPTQWDHELGNNADVSTLPDDTGATTGVASLQKLFQIINQTPLEAGGVAPDREDFNALFKILGDSVFYGMNGGLASYNPAYDYVVGRYVVYNNTLYKCIQANGASSTIVAPDSVSPLGSDYWTQVATLSDFTNKADKDFSNVTAPVQAFKDMSIGWGLPDYDSAISITPNASFTPDFDGFIQVNGNWSVGGGFRVSEGTTDNVNKTILGLTTGANSAGSFMTRIIKNQPYYFMTANMTTYFARIMPMKGAN